MTILYEHSVKGHFKVMPQGSQNELHQSYSFGVSCGMCHVDYFRIKLKLKMLYTEPI